MTAQPQVDRTEPPPPAAAATLPFWPRVRDHKVIQWAVAYLGAAIALAEGQEHVARALDWPDVAGRVVVIALIVGFPIAVTLAWYHGHRGFQRVSLAEATIISMLTLIGGVFLAAVLRTGTETTSAPLVERPVEPSNRAAGSGERWDPRPNSVAVLPCSNQSPDPNDAYFAIGIHEEILLQLAKLRNLDAIPRRAVLHYANSSLGTPAIAAELNVRNVLDCSVRYADDRVRISAELIDATSGRARWSDVYEREFEDIFAIQADIAMNIANAVGAEFSSAEQAALERAPTSSPEAYRLFLQSRVLIATQSPESIRQGLLLRRRALEIDPDFAPARVAMILGQVSDLVDTTSGRPYDSEARSSEHVRALQQSIEREIGLDPNLPLAYSAQGQLYLYTWRWTEALRNYRIAIDKGRGDLAGNQQYGLLTAYSNRTAEGIAALQQALDGEANSAEKFQILGILQAYTGDYDGALTDLRKGLDLTPTNPLASNWIAYVEIARGNTDQALGQLDFSRGILGDSVNVAFWAEFAYAYHRLGRPAEAERFRRDLLALSAERPLGAGTWAMMSIALGDNDKALEWLEIAAEKARNHEIDDGFWTVMNLKMNFLNDPLLNEPRFADVLSRIRGD